MFFTVKLAVLIILLVVVFVGVYLFTAAAIKQRIAAAVDKNAPPELQAQQAEAEEIKICQELSCQMSNFNFPSAGLY